MALRNSVYATLFPHKKTAPAPLAMSPDVSTGIADTVEDSGVNPPPVDSMEIVPASPVEADETQRQFPVQEIAPNPAPGNAPSNPPLTDFSSVKDYSPYQKAKADYETAVAAPVKHQNPFLQALFIGLQGAQKFFNPQNTDEIKFLGEAKHDREVERAARRLAPLEQQENRRIESDYKKAQTANIYADNEQKRIDSNTRAENSRLDREEKINNRLSRERTARMTSVAGILKNLPSYDPADTRFAELTKALGDVNLPLTPKDVKKKVDLKQDQRTGAWEVILTDPVSGRQEVRSVVKDGQQLKTTPTVVMQGEYGMLKQNDQQQFTANENEKNRQAAERRQQIGIQASQKLAEFKALVDKEKSETDFNRKKELQAQREQAAKDLATLRDQLKEDQ